MQCQACSFQLSALPVINQFINTVAMDLTQQDSNGLNSQDWNVYFARGHGFDLVEGNIFYRKLVHERSYCYKKAAATQKEKKTIVTDIISRVHAKGVKTSSAFILFCRNNCVELCFCFDCIS